MEAATNAVQKVGMRMDALVEDIGMLAMSSRNSGANLLVNRARIGLCKTLLISISRLAFS
jgi:hypothetical protein